MSQHPSYEIFEEIARGENTIVYRAYDLALGREVAVKQLSDQAREDANRLAQFLKEAQFLAQYEHENVLRIYSVETEQGWIVMELMKGTLAGQIDREAMDPDTVRSVLRQILTALDFLHRKGKVHGAVRPSNILINDEGTVKLSDFEESNVDGEMRAPSGAKKYVAPELLRTDFGAFGPTVDLYCLGFTALELLTGPKFDSFFAGTGEGSINADLAWLRWHSGDSPAPSVKKLAPSTPDDLAVVIDKMVAKNVADRPQAVKEVLELLDDKPLVPVDVPAAATPPASDKQPDRMTTPTQTRPQHAAAKPSHPQSSGKQVHQSASKLVRNASPLSTRDQINRFLEKPYVLIPLCLLMLGGAFGIGLMLMNDDDDGIGPVTELVDVELLILPSAEDATVVVGGRSVAPNKTDHIGLAPGEHQVTVEKEGFASYADRIVVSPSSRSFSITLSALPEVPLVDNRPDVPSTVDLQIDVTPADSQVVVNGMPQDNRSGAVHLSHKSSTDLDLVVSKDGFETQQLAMTWAELKNREYRLNVELDPIIELDPITDDRLTDNEQPAGQDRDATDGITDISQINNLDGLLLASKETPGTDETERKIAELADQYVGDAELVIGSGGFISEITDVAVSPDGSLVAAAGDKVVRIWDTSYGHLVATLRGDRSRTSYGNCYTVAFSPDGKHLLVGVNDYREHGSIRVYALSNLDEIEALLPGHTAPCRHLAFSRDGTHMISMDADGLLLIWNWEQRRIVKRVPAENAEQTIYDTLTFPTTDGVLFGIDYEGPQMFAVPDGKRLGPDDDFPESIRAWMIDLFGGNLKYPFGAEVDPRVYDFRFDLGRWAAAGVTRVEGKNRFWIGVWPGRKVQDTPNQDPKVTYLGHRWSVTSVAIGDSMIASGDKFGEVHLWDPTTGKTIHRFSGQGAPVYEVAFDEGSTRLAFGRSPLSPQDWKRNNYGTASHVLDLRQRSIFAVEAVDDLEPIQERPQVGDVSIRVRHKTGDANYFLEKVAGGKPSSRYRVSSGRNPTVFTVLPSTLGVDQPVVFGDNFGLLAMWDSNTDQLRRAFLGHDGMVSAISRSENGKLLASGSTDRTIRLWSLENYQPTGIFDFAFEDSSVIEVKPDTSSARNNVQVGDRILTIDGKSLTDMYNLMLEGKFDYKPGDTVPIRMQRGSETYSYDMELAEGYDFSDPVLNVYIGDNNQWIIWTPQGYYDTSPGADRLIGWHVNRGPDKSARYYEVQQFRDQLYRPDVIDRILDGSSVDQAVEDANSERGKPEDARDLRDKLDLARIHPPEVEIVSPSDDQQVREPQLRLAATVRSPNGDPIRSVTLLHNGSPAKVFAPPVPDATEFAVEHVVNLEPGANRLELVARSLNSTSQPTGISVRLVEESNQSNQPSLLALAVGVATHQQPNTRLTGTDQAADDARRFAEALRTQQRGKLYDAIRTQVLTDDQATHAAVKDALQWLVDNAKSGDTVMIYFSGHGIVDSRDNFYLSTHDVDVQRPRATAIAWREFIDTLHEDLPAVKRFIFLDVCPEQNAIKPRMRNPLLDLAVPELGTTFFASNSLQQGVGGSHPYRSGVFNRAILQALRDNATDVMPTPPDSLINPLELAASMSERMKAMTKGRQQPVAFAPAEISRRNFFELRN